MILTVSVVLLALGAGFAAASFQPDMVLFGLLAVLIFGISFVNIELGLYILIFSMLLSPEIIVGETTGGSGARGVTLRVEDFLLLIIGLSWFAKTSVVKDMGLFIRTPINKAIVIYITVSLVATLVGIIAGRVSPITGLLFVLKYVEYFVVYFMIANHIRNTGQIKRFLICLFLTAFTVAVIGTLQTPLGERVSAPFEGEVGEPNTFGGYLLLIGCVAAGLLAKVKDGRARIALIILIASLLPPFFLTQSRASYLGLIPAAMSLAILLERKVIIAGVVLLALILSPYFLPTIVKERILYTITQPEHPGQILIGDVRLDTSTSARLISWREAIADWTRKPLLGFGVTGYAFMDAQFPRVLIETGILGLAAFLYLVFTLFKMAFAHLKRVNAPVSRGLIIGFISGYIGLIVHSLGANTFIIVRIMEPFWFFAGMVAVLPCLEARTTGRSPLTAATVKYRESFPRHPDKDMPGQPFPDAR
jgi:O-antigen ligase